MKKIKLLTLNILLGVICFSQHTAAPVYSNTVKTGTYVYSYASYQGLDFSYEQGQIASESPWSIIGGCRLKIFNSKYHHSPQDSINTNTIMTTTYIKGMWRYAYEEQTYSTHLFTTVGMNLFLNFGVAVSVGNRFYIRTGEYSALGYDFEYYIVNPNPARIRHAIMFTKVIK